MAGHLELLPALDVQGGQAVRLAPGQAGSERASGDPVEAALRWQREGAEWLHLVDLDAAFGRGDNRAVLAEIVGRLDIRVQLSGGIDDDESLTAALAMGAARVNLATTALRDRVWCSGAIGRHGSRLAVSLDVRGRALSARGSSWQGGDLFDAVASLDAAGAARYVVTDVNRDGLLQGPNLDLLRSVCAVTDRPVIACGGIADLRHLTALQRLHALGVEGAIIGTALYEGCFTLEDALALTRPSV